MDTPPLQQLLDDIKSHIAAGRKIEAIKLYRDATGAGLAEAKEAVELIEADRPPRPASPSVLSDDGLRKVLALVVNGRKIEAIKRYRDATGVGLKEAKDAIDSLEARLYPAAVAARNAAMRHMWRLLIISLLISIAAVVLVLVLSRA